ncbi:MAG: GAF domain-containing protein, partial [Deltaproteobacteria bacterium]|nr:GAF domain-containing protein [Deltaproteobacteria bacterium]
MVTSKETNMDEVARLAQERDMFKRQFLKVQDNYENKITELSILKELGNTLRSTNFHDKEAFFWSQLKIIKRYTTLEDLVLILLDEELNILEIIAESNSDGPMREPRGLSLIEHDPAQQVIAEAGIVAIENMRNDSAQIEDGTNHEGSQLYIPITHNAKAIGVLKLQHIKTNGFSQNHVRFFSLVADQIATQVILFRIYRQMLREEKQRL